MSYGGWYPGWYPRPTTNGYRCGYCGAWVSFGQFHSCAPMTYPTAPAQPAKAVPTQIPAIPQKAIDALERIADSLAKIADALELKDKPEESGEE